MKKKPLAIALGSLGIVVLAGVVAAHCEIPCGIYNDKMRIVMIREDITTIEKSMNMIVEIGAAEEPNHNQLIRWVMNKEKHAEKIQEVVSQYFLTQRVTVPADGDTVANQKYVRQLASLHGLLVSAMKMKQTTDLDHVEKARSLVNDFAAAYFSAEDIEHLKEHD